MAKPVASTSQLRKLLFTKHYSDQYGYVWRVSAWKGLFWMVVGLLLLIVMYSFFVQDQQGYLQDVLFYAIITMIVVVVAWVLSHFVWKARKVFIGFVLAWILILVLYFVMGWIFSYVQLMEFHYGMTTWIVITFLAALGSTRIDGKIDKNDVFFSFLVLIILIGGNLPVFETGGFFSELDKFFGIVTENLPKLFNLGKVFE